MNIRTRRLSRRLLRSRAEVWLREPVALPTPITPLDRSDMLLIAFICCMCALIPNVGFALMALIAVLIATTDEKDSNAA